MVRIERPDSPDFTAAADANLQSHVVHTNPNDSRDAWNAIQDGVRASTLHALEQFGDLFLTGLTDADAPAGNDSPPQGWGSPRRTTEGDPSRNRQREVRPALPQLDLHADTPDIREYLRNNRPALDYGRLFTQNNRLVLLGDIHRSAAVHEHVAASAADMERAGVTHFAMEMIPSSMQQVLDRFYNGDRAARREIETYLNNTWDRSYPGTGPQYMRILDAMREHGIRPVGLDVHGHQDATNAHARQRDQHWAFTLQNILRLDPNARVVAFGGSQHFGRWNDATTSAILQRDYGVSSNTVHFVGGDRRISHLGVPDEEARQRELGHNVIPRLSRQLGLGDRSFMVPVDSARFIANTFVHLPQRPAE